MSTSSEDEIVKEPSMTKNSSPSRAPKTAAPLQTTWRSAKMPHFTKKNSPPPQPPYGEVLDELRQKDLHDRDIDHVQMFCNCGTFTVF